MDLFRFKIWVTSLGIPGIGKFGKRIEFIGIGPVYPLVVTKPELKFDYFQIQ
jgi:hypothetical protein